MCVCIIELLGRRNHKTSAHEYISIGAVVSQVSWSSDGGSIAMVGNGFDSRVMVYSLRRESERSTLSVELKWQDQAGIVSKKHWGGKGEGTAATPSDRARDEAARIQRFNAISLTPAFETCEFLPSGCVVATENCPDGMANLIHMYSVVGEHLKVSHTQTHRHT